MIRRPGRSGCLAVLACGLATGCALRPTTEEEETARRLLAVVSRGEAIPQEQMDSSLRTPENLSGLALVSEQLRPIDAFSAKRRWTGVTRRADGRIWVTFDFEVAAKDGPSVARVVLQRGTPPVLIGLRVRRVN